jgi:acetyl esterase/lipase
LPAPPGAHYTYGVGTSFLVFGVALAALTAISLSPLYRPGALALVGWVPAWLFSELPVHLALIALGVGTGFVVGGALDSWQGWVGLAATLLAAAGLARHVVLARTTEARVERGLAEAFGEGYAERIEADLRRRYDPRRSLGAVAAVFPFRPRTVERIRNLVYAKVGRRTLTLDVIRAVDPAGRLAVDAAEAGAAPASPEVAAAAATGRGAPVFLYVHGGGWVIGNKRQQGRVLLHELAAAGWICVAINYRLSPRATWPEHILDVKHAIGWVKQHIAEHGGDPGFVVIGGGSAGAHLASLAALTPDAAEWQRDLAEVDTSVQGCVAFYGVYDFVDDERIWRHRAFRHLLLERVVMKRRAREAREEYVKASPIARIGGRVPPPFLVVHGGADSLAPVAGARRFRDALAKAGGQVAYVELPGANHAFELFPSLRSVPVNHGVHRFCQLVYSQFLAAKRSRPVDGTASPSGISSGTRV